MAARSRNVYLLCSENSKDTGLRDALAKHLEGPALAGVTVCHDGQMRTGARHDEWRRQHLREADLVVALLSVDFLPLLDLFEEEVAGKGRPFLPVLLRPADLKGTFFAGRKLACEDGGLAGRQGDAAKQQAYVEICEEVLRLLPDGEAGPGGGGAGGERGEADEDRDDEGLERVLRRKLPLGDPEVLECDRTVQWDHLTAAAGRPGHEVLLLPGGSKQGHTFFLIRARLCLPIPRGQRQPPSVLGLPHYYPRPGHEADFLSALAESLRCAEDQVASRLRQRLQRGTLLVVPEEHRGNSGEDDGALVECLTSWLPRLLDQVGQVPYGLKWVHALSYYEAPAWAHLTARWLGVPRKAAQRVRIESLCARLRREAHARVGVTPLDPLDPIREAHILEFAEKRLRMGPAERRAFLDRVTSGDETSAAILEMIQTHYQKTIKRKDRR